VKKKIIICVFSFLILATAIWSVTAAIDSYRYDMDPKNDVDIMEGIGAAMIILVGGFLIFYELDLFYTVYYFLIKPKTVTRSILNLLSNASLVLLFFSGDIADILQIKEEGLVSISLFYLYLVLRCIYCLILSCSYTKKEQF